MNVFFLPPLAALLVLSGCMSNEGSVQYDKSVVTVSGVTHVGEVDGCKLWMVSLLSYGGMRERPAFVTTCQPAPEAE